MEWEEWDLRRREREIKEIMFVDVGMKENDQEMYEGLLRSQGKGEHWDRREGK